MISTCSDASTSASPAIPAIAGLRLRGRSQELERSTPMPHPTSILCPIDFSEPSVGALRYGAFVATQLGARLIALTVEDPLVAEAHTLGGGLVWRPDDTRIELEAFVKGAVGEEPGAPSIDCEVAIGKPAPEILRVARQRSSDLIVMSTRGLTGMRKLFFGSTTERVLRETTVPVLVTPPFETGSLTLDGLSRGVQRVVVPVDLVSDSSHLTRAASLIARALALPILLVHVVEPLRGPFAGRLRVTQVDAERRARADEALTRIASSLAVVRT